MVQRQGVRSRLVVSHFTSTVLEPRLRRWHARWWRHWTMALKLTAICESCLDSFVAMKLWSQWQSVYISCCKYHKKCMRVRTSRYGNSKLVITLYFLYCNHTVFLTMSLLCYVLFQNDPSTDFTFGLGQVVDENRGSLPCDDSMELASKLNFTVITYLRVYLLSFLLLFFVYCCCLDGNGILWFHTVNAHVPQWWVCW